MNEYKKLITNLFLEGFIDGSYWGLIIIAPAILVSVYLNDGILKNILIAVSIIAGVISSILLLKKFLKINIIRERISDVAALEGANEFSTNPPDNIDLNRNEIIIKNK